MVKIVLLISILFTYLLKFPFFYFSRFHLFFFNPSDVKLAETEFPFFTKELVFIIMENNKFKLGRASKLHVVEPVPQETQLS